MAKKEFRYYPDLAIQKYQEHIEQVLLETEVLLKVQITIHDLTGIFRGPEGQFLMERNRGIHHHTCCILAKRKNEQNCLKACQQDAHQEVASRQGPWIHQCWGGVSEVVAPVIRDNSHLFTIFVGLFRGKEKPEWKNSPRYQKEYQNLPAITQAEAARLGNVIGTLGQGLLTYVEEVNKLHQASPGRKGEIRRFLHYHVHEKLTLNDLARTLNLSPSRTSHLVTELFEMSFKSLLLTERIQRGRALLLSATDWSVADVGRQVGIPDEYHFNRAFKKVVGLPPGRFRKQHRTGT